MRCFIGIDLGSTTTKAVVIDEQQNILGRGITNSRSNYDTAAAIAKQEALVNGRFYLFRQALSQTGALRDSLDAFLAQLEALRRSGRVIVVLGDWNIAPDDRDVHDPRKWAGEVLCSEPERTAFQALLGWGLTDVWRAHHGDERAYSWWDYRGVAFWKDQGWRIDHFLADAAVAARVTACTIDREARKGQDASDHAPVIATLA